MRPKTRRSPRDKRGRGTLVVRLVCRLCPEGPFINVGDKQRLFRAGLFRHLALDAQTMATENDRAVLEAVFNPLFSEFGFSTEAEEALSGDAVQEDGTPNQVKTLEVEGVQAAEKGDIDQAIEIFSEVIRLVPNRASGYNNRAQALRIKGDVDRALEDLNNAINLGQGNKHAAAQALCQRGLIYRLREQDQDAQADFKEAAKLGSPFAKNQLVQMNPYAALCNRMLGQMFAKLRQGEDDTR